MSRFQEVEKVLEVTGPIKFFDLRVAGLPPQIEAPQLVSPRAPSRSCCKLEDCKCSISKKVYPVGTIVTPDHFHPEHPELGQDIGGIYFDTNYQITTGWPRLSNGNQTANFGWYGNVTPMGKVLKIPNEDMYVAEALTLDRVRPFCWINDIHGMKELQEGLVIHHNGGMMFPLCNLSKHSMNTESSSHRRAPRVLGIWGSFRISEEGAISFSYEIPAHLVT